MESTQLTPKIDRVKGRLKELGSVAIAFSGGKDSFFLLKTAVEALGKEKVTAFFVETALLTDNDKKRVDYFSSLLDFNLRRLTIDVTGEEKVMSNPVDRCYHCKSKIFTTLKREAAALGISHLLDGTTSSDLGEYRPGLKAIEELGVLSPLEGAGITSAEIVAYLKKLPDIDDYFTTSSTCLATRFPYNLTLDPATLQKFATIETFFVDAGIYPVKIRYIEDGIRIETPGENFSRVFEMQAQILELCKAQGMKFITLDLEGLRSGVWDS